MACVSTMRIFEKMKATLTLTTIKVNARWVGESRLMQQPRGASPDTPEPPLTDKALTLTAVNLNARPLHLFPNTQLQHSHQREVTQ